MLNNTYTTLLAALTLTIVSPFVSAACDHQTQKMFLTQQKEGIDSVVTTYLSEPDNLSALKVGFEQIVLAEAYLLANECIAKTSNRLVMRRTPVTNLSEISTSSFKLFQQDIEQSLAINLLSTDYLRNRYRVTEKDGSYE